MVKLDFGSDCFSSCFLHTFLLLLDLRHFQVEGISDTTDSESFEVLFKHLQNVRTFSLNVCPCKAFVFLSFVPNGILN